MVGDFKSRGLALDTHPAVFPPLRQMPSEAVDLLVKGRLSPDALLAAARDALWRVDPDLAPDDMIAMSSLLAETTADRRVVLRLFGSFGSLAFLLALTGIAAAVAESVESRRRELGLRRALGASSAGLYRLVVGESVRLNAAAVAVGLVVAVAVTHLLEPWLYEISAVAPAAFALGGSVLPGCGLLVAAVPAARAIASDPSVVLKESTE